MATSTTSARSLGAIETRRTVSVHGARHFVRHLGEMLLAMVVGMMVLGALDRGILAAAGTSASHVRHGAGGGRAGDGVQYECGHGGLDA
jgi:hypothetical protein